MENLVFRAHDYNQRAVQTSEQVYDYLACPECWNGAIRSCMLLVNRYRRAVQHTFNAENISLRGLGGVNGNLVFLAPECNQRVVQTT